MTPTRPFAITASTAPPQKKPWFAVKALHEGDKRIGELRLRGEIGYPSHYQDYWTGQEVETHGAGTVKDFEAKLLALGEVDLIHLYITSEGGCFATAIAISSILARQQARIICYIDGYAYSAAPVIACAADEIHASKNALIMIHDAEYWCGGSDVDSLQKAIETLTACNQSMAAAFINKAGGTEEEWQTRMRATTWLTGESAHALGLVDVLMDEVSLSAYAPLKQVSARYSPPPYIQALIDKAPPTDPQQSSHTQNMKIVIRARGKQATKKATALATHKKITAEKKEGEEEEVTAEETEKKEGEEEEKTTAEDEVEIDPDELADALTPAIEEAVEKAVADITAKISALEQSVKITATGARARGAPPIPNTGSETKPDLTKMTAMQLIGAGRKTATA